MSRLSSWLATRRPEPAPDLAKAIAFEEASGELEQVLTTEGLSRLHLARARLGRERASAFRLLEADALITYACEAALDGEAPEDALRRILVTTAS